MVFVAKYRAAVFDAAAVEALRDIFKKVRADFESTLVECDGESDHVHLLAEYPPKVAMSELVNSLQGASSRLIRKRHPGVKKLCRKEALSSPSYFAACCGGGPLSIIEQNIERQQTPGSLISPP